MKMFWFGIDGSPKYKLNGIQANTFEEAKVMAGDLMTAYGVDKINNAYFIVSEEEGSFIYLKKQGE